MELKISETKTNDGSEYSQKGRRNTWINYFIGDIYSDDDPQDLPTTRKNVVILLVAIIGVYGPLGSMIYLPALLNIANDLQASRSAVNGTVSAFVVCMGTAVGSQ